MKKILKIIGRFFETASGVLLLIFWFIAMTKWLGPWGGVLAIVAFPAMVVFPIVFWIVERVFPVNYFII
jgi:hypothetical protein